MAYLVPQLWFLPRSTPRSAKETPPNSPQPQLFHPLPLRRPPTPSPNRVPGPNPRARGRRKQLPKIKPLMKDKTLKTLKVGWKHSACPPMLLKVCWKTRMQRCSWGEDWAVPNLISLTLKGARVSKSGHCTPKRGNVPWAASMLLLRWEEEASVRFSTSQRMAALDALISLCLLQSSEKRAMFGYWPAFIPDTPGMGAPPQSPTLFTSILKDPVPKVSVTNCGFVVEKRLA